MSFRSDCLRVIVFFSSVVYKAEHGTIKKLNLEEKVLVLHVLTVGIVKFSTKGLVSFPSDCPKVILFVSFTVFVVTMSEMHGLNQKN